MLVLFGFFKSGASVCSAKKFRSTCSLTKPTYDASSAYQSVAKWRFTAPDPGCDEPVFEGLNASRGNIQFIINSFNVW
jgi:hypothetical protein